MNERLWRPWGCPIPQGSAVTPLTPSGWIKGYASDSSPVCHWQVGRKGEREGSGSPWEIASQPPRYFSFLHFPYT